MNRDCRLGLDALKYTRAFLVLADEMHFGRAARRLHIAQPSLTKQMSMLEAALGFRLFVKSGRGVRLTVAGTRYVDGMREVMCLAGETTAAAKLAARSGSSVLRIGYVSAAMFSAIPSALARFGRRFPLVQPRLIPRLTSRQVEDLHAGSIDVACVRGCVRSTSLVTSTICKERLLAAIPADHRLASSRSVSLTDLSSDVYVTFPYQLAEDLGSVILRAWRLSEARPRRAFEASDWPEIIAHVANGKAFSIVPESVRHIGIAGVKYLPLVDCDLRSELSVAHRSDDQREEVKWVVSRLKQAA